MRCHKQNFRDIRNEVSSLRGKICSLDSRVNNIIQKIEKHSLNYSSSSSLKGCNEHISRKRSDVKKHLIFYGVDLDDVRLELIRFEEYCQDILEARIRSVLYEQLNITRDIPMDMVYRLEAAGDDPRTRPIVASLTNQADKWEILCLARVTKMAKITITEDISNAKT